MQAFIRKYWKTLLFFSIVGLVGGFFTGIYLLDSYPAEIRQQVLEQGMTATLLGLVSAAQAAGYGIVLGAAGILLGKKTGLWKDEKTITKKPLKDMNFPRNAIVGGVIRGNESYIAVGDTHIQAYDRVAVFALPESVKEVDKFFR